MQMQMQMQIKMIAIIVLDINGLAIAALFLKDYNMQVKDDTKITL